MIICTSCKSLFSPERDGRSCPHCSSPLSDAYSDLKALEPVLVPIVLKERTRYGLDGLTGGLEFVVINTEPECQCNAVTELLATTGFEFREAYDEGDIRTAVLGLEGSADIIVRSRLIGGNPFAAVNDFPGAEAFPNTRLETFVFSTPDIERYVSIQKSRGVRFLTDEIVRTDTYSFIQTEPSPYTGNSVGLVQWHGASRTYMHGVAKPLDWRFGKPQLPHLSNIGCLDHAATRVRAEERDAAIVEFMLLTDYHFDFAILVKSLNSITNVARLTRKDFAMVFTSGERPYIDDEVTGPTERFTHRYGPRTHHIAFHTERIEDTVAALLGDGMKFLLELAGSREDGLKQIFSEPSPNTYLVTEYIHRYNGFDGFFTRSNVTELTRATERQ